MLKVWSVLGLLECIIDLVTLVYSGKTKLVTAESKFKLLRNIKGRTEHRRNYSYHN